ncbi:hypothetical protein ACOMHN_006971 [Nucella lapillus]
MRVMYGFWAVVTALLLHVQVSSSKRDKAIFCSVCRALVDEINARISERDPTKRIHVRGYRLDPEGNQKLAQVKYATSDLHLTEILDEVCKSFKDYGLLHDDNTQKDSVVRTKDRSGMELDTSNARVDPHLKNVLKSYCEEVIEETEDDIMKIFKQDDHEAIEEQLCGEVSGACTEEELMEPILKLKEKVPVGKPNSFHILEPGDDTPRALDGVHTLQDMRNKILEAAQVSNEPCDNTEEDAEKEDEEDEDEEDGSLKDEL